LRYIADFQATFFCKSNCAENRKKELFQNNQFSQNYLISQIIQITQIIPIPPQNPRRHLGTIALIIVQLISP